MIFLIYELEIYRPRTRARDLPTFRKNSTHHLIWGGSVRPPAAPPLSIAHLTRSLLLLLPSDCAALALTPVLARGAVPLFVTQALVPWSMLGRVIIDVLEAALAIPQPALPSVGVPVGASAELVGCIATVMTFRGLPSRFASPSWFSYCRHRNHVLLHWSCRGRIFWRT